MTVSNLPLNIHPKIAWLVLSAVVAWCLAHYGVELDPEVSGAVSLLIGSLVGYRAPAADVVIERGPASDDLLSPQAHENLENV